MDKDKVRIIIHDLQEQPTFKTGKNTIIFSNEQKPNHCIGCFGCWIKTPSACVIKDSYKELGALFCQAEEIVFISKCFYGGFSPFVKNVLDRCIGCLLPFFSIRNGEMHHTPRTSNQPKIIAHFYGDISESEKKTAKQLIPAIGINIVACETAVHFYNTGTDIKEALA